jgi:hypothetical protein
VTKGTGEYGRPAAIGKSQDFLVKRKTELVAMLFYKRLFQLDPSLKMLFRGDMTKQAF